MQPMIPVLVDLGPVQLMTHDAFVILGLVVALLVLWRTPHRRPAGAPVEFMVAGGLFGGALFAKAATGWRYVSVADDPTVLGLWVHGGQSLLGGLAGAYLGVLVAKRLSGYRASTGDWFAPAVAAGLAVGRVGCFLTEQIGTPTSLPWGIAVGAETAATMPYCPSCATGLPMHPSFLYEIVFHLFAFAVLMRVRSRKPGDAFKLYLVAYGLFRFVVEFVRDNPDMAWGLSGSQLFLLITVPVALALMTWRVRSAVPLEATR
jgi:phosphatidylglycerol---prolipoprotein diacylglyceryl transferase